LTTTNTDSIDANITINSKYANLVYSLTKQEYAALKQSIKENGHCTNPIHNTTKNNKPAGCYIGSKFHKALYDDYQSLLENFIGRVKDCTPVVIIPLKQKGTGHD
jgi:hypothetical protein